MPIEYSLTKLRVAMRKNGKLIIDQLVEDYLVHRQTRRDLVITNRCVFCGSIENLTREHVLPKWLFEDIQNRFYVNGANGLRQPYIKTTVPACKVCNSERLNQVERHIKWIFQNRKVGTKSFSKEDYENIIRWLEIIHLKFQVTDLMKRFFAHKDGGMIDYLKEFPLAMLRDGGISSFKVEVELRSSLRRIAVKDKSKRIGSLCFFKTTNKEFYFFHNNDFIFLELPQFGFALMYFFEKIFESEKDLQREVDNVIEKHYN